MHFSLSSNKRFLVYGGCFLRLCLLYVLVGRAVAFLSFHSATMRNGIKNKEFFKLKFSVTCPRFFQRFWEGGGDDQ